MQTDTELLAAVASRDELAFADLYERYRAPIRRHALRFVGADEAAEDVTQEVFLRVWQRSGQWDGRGSAAGWMYRIATNLSLNHLRSLRRRVVSPGGMMCDDEDVFHRVADTTSAGPEEAAVRADRVRRLLESVRELSERKREVMSILMTEDITLREVSERLDLPLGTVKSRVHNASRDLRRKLEADR